MIAILEASRNTWKIIKNKPDLKPLNIVFISFMNTNNDLSNQYELLKIEIKNNINPNQKISPCHYIKIDNNNINLTKNNTE